MASTEGVSLSHSAVSSDSVQRCGQVSMDLGIGDRRVHT